MPRLAWQRRPSIVAAIVVAAAVGTIGIARAINGAPPKAHQATVVASSAGHADLAVVTNALSAAAGLVGHQLAGDARRASQRSGSPCEPCFSAPFSSRASASAEEPDRGTSCDTARDVDGELVRQLDELISCIQRIELGAVDELSAGDQPVGREHATHPVHPARIRAKRNPRPRQGRPRHPVRRHTSSAQDPHLHPPQRHRSGWLCS